MQGGWGAGRAQQVGTGASTQSCHHYRQRQTQNSCTLIQLSPAPRTYAPDGDISTKLLHHIHFHFHHPGPRHCLPASINLSVQTSSSVTIRHLRSAARHNIAGWHGAVQSSTPRHIKCNTEQYKRHIKAGLAAHTAQHSTQVSVTQYNTINGMVPHSNSAQGNLHSTARFPGCAPHCTRAHIPRSRTRPALTTLPSSSAGWCSQAGPSTPPPLPRPAVRVSGCQCVSAGTRMPQVCLLPLLCTPCPRPNAVIKCRSSAAATLTKQAMRPDLMSMGQPACS
jgi:hypothetical protein